MLNSLRARHAELIKGASPLRGGAACAFRLSTGSSTPRGMLPISRLVRHEFAWRGKKVCQQQWSLAK